MIPCFQEKPLSFSYILTVPQTDTGARDEYSKALERTLEKELGKLPPYLRKKEALMVRKHFEGAQARG